jgi:hemolysin type calcium-binding protein
MGRFAFDRRAGIRRPRHAFLSAGVALVAAAAAIPPADAQTPTVVTATHVQTIQTSLYGPPSPDPAGIAYVAATDRFLIGDSEVDELPTYLGKNLFTATRSGLGAGTGTTVGFSNEPSGVGYDRATHTLFIADDDRNRVYVDRPGPDGVHGGADDAVTSFSTSAFGAFDPEGVEHDPYSGHVFIADGAGIEVYDVNPVNGVFGDGDDTVAHFDVSQYGARDAEGLGIDPQRNVLLVIDPSTKSIYELAKTGRLVRTVDLRTIPGANGTYAGVTVAPSSDPNDDPARLNYWIVDRQVDNAADPLENDGRLYEVSAPPGPAAPGDAPLSGTPVPVAPPPAAPAPVASPPAAPPPAPAPPPRTLRGTAANDVLVGTPGDDVIYGFGGNDVIYGRGGNDVVVGGAGRDRLTGGRGRDDLYGKSGNDTLWARDGARDTVRGGRGRDAGRADRRDRVRSLERRR